MCSPTHLDDVALEAEQQVQRDLFSWQGVQTGQSWVHATQLHHFETFLFRSQYEAMLAQKKVWIVNR